MNPHVCQVLKKESFKTLNPIGNLMIKMDIRKKHNWGINTGR